jgi:hypothetical protein
MAAGRRRVPIPYSESNDFKALTKAIFTASSSSSAPLTGAQDHCSLSRVQSRSAAGR